MMGNVIQRSRIQDIRIGDTILKLKDDIALQMCVLGDDMTIPKSQIILSGSSRW